MDQTRRTPYRDLLFLTSGTLFQGFTVEQRKAILEELERRGGDISKDFIEELLSKMTNRNYVRLLELEYHLSSNESSIWGASIHWDKEKAQNATQLLNYLVLSSGMKYMEGYHNPPVSRVSLNPKVRLDLAEIRSAEGFRTYDYVPISPESLARTHGEVIPSLNAVPVEGVGGTVRDRIGEVVEPIEITYEMRLDPEGYAYKVAEKYSINLQGSGQEITIKFNPDLVSAGKSRKLTPTIIEIGPEAFVSEEELANTIAHELNHARDWLKGGTAPEWPEGIHSGAYSAGDALSEYIRGER